MHPDTQYALRKDWQDFKDYDWMSNAKDVTGWREAFPTATESEKLANRETCLHGNSENRVITQNGVSDEIGYRRCVLDPYPQGPNTPGLRMGNRPEPQG